MQSGGWLGTQPDPSPAISKSTELRRDGQELLVGRPLVLIQFSL